MNLILIGALHSKLNASLQGNVKKRGLYLEKSYIPHQREVCHFHWKTELGYFDKGYKVKKTQ